MTAEQLGDVILQSERQLYLTAKTLLYNDQDCADAIQETIVKAFSKIRTLRHDEYAKTWLMRILMNECYNILRKQSKVVLFEELPKETAAFGEENSHFDEVYQAINSLKEDLKMPVILYYFEDFSIKEIAQVLDITEGAIQKRLARARGKLKNHLLEGGHIYEF